MRRDMQKVAVSRIVRLITTTRQIHHQSQSLIMFKLIFIDILYNSNKSEKFRKKYEVGHVAF